MSQEPVTGVDEATKQYGQPVVRSYRYDVSAASLLYWQLMRARRQAEVVLALRRPGGGYLVHTKAFYPEGTWRLLSGGIQPGEDLLAAVAREACEETGLPVQIERFLAIQRHTFQHGGEEVAFTSYLFLVSQQDGTVASQDVAEAITGFRVVPLAELNTLAEALEALPPEWADWGRFRASAHRLLAELLREGEV